MALDTNLVSWWKLDESSGNASDSKGSNTLTNTSVTYNTGKINNGGVFVAGSSSKLAATGTGLPTSGDFTMACWYKGATPVNDGIMGFGSVNANGQMRMILVVGGKAYFGGYNYDLDSTFTITTGNWHHLVFTYSGTTATWYVDGTQRNSATITALNTANTNLRIGCRPDDTSFISAQIDEAGIWSRAITSGEVTTLYNAGAGISYPFGTAYNMAVTVGAFVLTGVNSALRIALRMATVVGAFVLTGVNVLFALGKGISATVGQFVLTGNNIAYHVALTMAVTVGAFVLTGIDVALRKVYTLVANTASFILTGFAVRLPIFWRNVMKHVVTVRNIDRTNV